MTKLRRSVAIAAISASVIGVQIGFMRALSVTRGFHFSYFVISIALLGFGASGTVLALARRRIADVQPWPGHRVIVAAAGGFVLAVPACLSLALRIPIEFQYLLLDPSELLPLSVFAILAFVPFFCAGLAIGALLTRYSADGPLLYGANLVGSGAGAAGVLLVATVVDPSALAHVAGLPAAIGFALLWPEIPGNRWIRVAAVALVVGISAGGAAAPPEPIVDQYKALAHFRTLEDQGAARRLSTFVSPQGRLDIFEAESFHYSPFASPLPGASPPDQHALLLDGSVVGTVVANPEAGDHETMLDALPQSTAYRIAEPRRVLLLGATGGTAVRLARRHGVSAITVVQPHRALASLLDGWVNADGVGPSAEIVATDPRLYLEQTNERYDVIHVVSAETMPAAGSGLHSLNENYLLTVGGVSAMIRRLSTGGIVTITRGTQTPPRDNIRIFATAAAALRAAGRDPATSLLQGRNYLSVTTLIGAAGFGAPAIDAFGEAARELVMDVEYAPGMAPPQEQRNEIAGPPGEAYSYYYAANQAILSDSPEELYARWVYRVAPPTDESPYFDNFFRWRTLSEFRRTFGAAWIRRLELGYVVLSATAVLVFVLSVVLIALPLAVPRRQRIEGAPPDRPTRRRRVGRLSVVGYFATLGFGFLFVEIVAIQTFSQALGHQVYSTTAVLAGLLVFSGLGSVTQERVLDSAARRIRLGSVAAFGVILGFVAVRRFVITGTASLGIAGRFVAVLALLLPVAYLLGWFFSSVLRVVGDHAPDLAIEVGHSVVLAVAATLYLTVGLYPRRWLGYQHGS